MSRQFLVTTTSTVIIDDMGDLELTHPTVDRDLLLEFKYHKILDSADLQASLDAGDITIKDEDSVNITNISEQFGLIGTQLGAATRTDFTIVQNVSDLPAPSGGVITLDKSYEINGKITSAYSIDNNGFKLVGRDAALDWFEYTGSGAAFTGTDTGLTLEVIKISATSGKLFDKTNTGQTVPFVLDGVSFGSGLNQSLVEGFSLIVCRTVQSVLNVSGIEFKNYNDLFLDQFIVVNTTGTGITLTGTSNTTSITGCVFQPLVPVASTGLDRSGLTSIVAYASIDTATSFLGAGAHITADPLDKWTVEAGGTALEGDKFSSAQMHMIGGVTDTLLTVNVWEKLEMPSLAIDSATTHRFIQHPTIPEAIQYKGLSDIVIDYRFYAILRRLGGGTNDYEISLTLNGVQISGIEEHFELSALDKGQYFGWKLKLSTDDYIYPIIRNVTDSDDIRALTGKIRI